MKSIEPAFLKGKAIVLAPLGPSDVSEAYLAWLNDPAVLRYRAPKAFPTTMPQLEDWVKSLPGRNDLVLTIRTQNDSRHIGNISLNNIQWVHRSAELAIMIGATDVWGGGHGSEAIELLSAHAFTAMGLNRLAADSPNPAFNASMKKLGWVHEGTRRKAFMVDGGFTDFESWGLLAEEWKARNPAR